MADLRWGILLLIPLAWCAVSFMLARLSGWTRLAKYYRHDEFLPDETGRFRSASLGVIQYSSCLMFSVNDAGLRIAIFPLLRLGHPPLVIPWDQIHHIEAENRLYSQRVKLSIGKPTIVRASLPGWVRYRMPLEMRPKA